MSDNKPNSFWSNLPRILGSLAALIGAIAGLLQLFPLNDGDDTVNPSPEKNKFFLEQPFHNPLDNENKIALHIDDDQNDINPDNNQPENNLIINNVEEEAQGNPIPVKNEELNNKEIQDENMEINLEEPEQEAIQKADPIIGWIYVGHFKSGTYGNTNTLELKSLPRESNIYQTNRDINLRKGYPTWPYIKFPDEIGIIKKGSSVKILHVEPKVGKKKVWAKIEFLK